jgi:hypothetical protein
MDDYEIPKEYKQRELLVNKIRCPDGTVLQSTHQHDFKQHIQEDGREYFIDGGTQYQRIGYSDLEFEDLSLYTDDPHEKIREEFIWGRNFDKNGKKLPQTEYIALKDLEDGHLESLCYFTLKGYPAKINQVLVNEWNYRIEQNEFGWGDYE